MAVTSPSSAPNESADKSTLSYRTLSALFWTFGGSSIQLVLRLLTLMILARLLMPADFGLVAAALTVVQFSEIFALLGVGPALVQRAELEERHLRTGFTFSILFGLSLAGLIWLAAPAIASFYQSDRLTPVLRVIILTFPLSGLTVVAQSLMQREFLFRKLAGIEVAAYAIGTGIVGIGLALLGFGVWALAIAYVVQEAIKAIAILVVHPHSKKPQFELRAFKELFYFGGGFTLARVFNYLALQGDNLVVGRWLGVGALGLYGRAYNLMTISVTILGQVLDKVLFSAMAKVQNEPERLAIAYRRGTALIGLLILPTSVGAYILAPELINVLLGPAWSGVVVPFQLLVIGMLFRTSYKMNVALARSQGAVYRNAWRQGIYALLVLGGAWIGQHWGLRGVALGVLGALAIHFLLMAQLGLSMIPFSWRQLWSIHLPGIWCAAIIGVEVGGVATVLRNLNQAPIVILISCAVVVLATALALVRFLPIQILGTDGIWIVRVLLKRLPQHFFFLT